MSEQIRTEILTEIGCAYGRLLGEQINVIDTTARKELDEANKIQNTQPAEDDWTIAEMSAVAKKRLADVEVLKKLISGCTNCKGSPEDAQMSDRVCPMAKYAVQIMTHPGNIN